MKKLLALLISAVMILALPSLAVSAAYGAELTVSNAEASTGEAAEILISISGNPGLCALGFEIQYDKSVLTVVSAEFTDLLSAASKRVNVQDGRIIFNAASADNINGDGAVAKIVFKVTANSFKGATVNVAPLGETGFVLHSEADHSLADVTLKLNNGSIIPPGGSVTDIPTTEVPACTHKNTVSETVKASTCTTKGVALTRCADCGISLGETELPLADHTAGEWETVTEPTADSEGRAEKKCTACGETLETKALEKTTSEVTETAATTTGSITVQPIEESNSAIVLIVIAAVIVAGLLIAFTVFKAKADKKKRNADFF